MNNTSLSTRFHYLLHPYSTFLVTCCNAEAQPNIITIAWLMPVSVIPPLLAFSIKPTRYSYRLIHMSGEFVVNVGSLDLAQSALFCGRCSGQNVDKFAETGLTPGKARFVQPPIIQECLAHLECNLVHDIQAGDHHILTAEVLAAYAQTGVLTEEGFYDLNRVQPLLHVGRDRFTCPDSEYIEPVLPNTQ
jgi:flavin reductase (DIM6/NTAB) family NADH-FMN oxidoreductase RutF